MIWYKPRFVSFTFILRIACDVLDQAGCRLNCKWLAIHLIAIFFFLIANCLQYIPLQFAIDRIHNSNQFAKGDPKGTSRHIAIGHLPGSFRFIQPSSSVAVQYIAIYTCILNCTHCNIYMYIDCTYCNIYMYIELYVLQYIHVVQYTVQCIASKWVCNEI